MFLGLIGTLFSRNKEPAFAALKMCQSLSAFSLFASAPYLCTKVKIIIVICVLLLAMIGYVTLEVTLKMEQFTKPSAETNLVESGEVVKKSKDLEQA